MYAKGSFTGNYETIGRTQDADCVIGHAFGIRDDDPGLSNRALADYIEQRLTWLPHIVNRDIARVMDFEPDFELEVDPSSTSGGGLGTWEELRQAKKYMLEHGLERPILVAHSYHIGRVATQAYRSGLMPIVPPELPGVFDAESNQWWTRNRGLWTVRELAGVAVLKIIHQI
jgi:hypothetical protein